MKTKQTIQYSSIAFGTSGARGLVTDFTPDVTAAFVHAFLTVMKKSFIFQKVAIGIDNRPSSYFIAQACSDAVRKQGFQAVFYGVLPTPALAYQSMKDEIPCVMVTGSHIPFDRNGLKFYRPDGEITKNDENEILYCDVQFSPPDVLPDLTVSSVAAESYIQRYVSLFDSNLLAGKRIGIYEHSSAGRDLYAKVFIALGGEVVSIGRSNEFVPIDTEAVSLEDRCSAIKWSADFSLDVIFSTDGDGDRPLVADEEGNWLRGDILGLLSAKALKIEAIAIPVSCNTAVEKSNFFSKVVKTKIGSPYVIEAFEDLNPTFKSYAGFEANGGFLLGSDIIFNNNVLSALPTRDALLPALMLLSLSKRQKISALVNELPRRFTFSDRISDFPSILSGTIIDRAVQNPQSFFNELKLETYKPVDSDTTDGLRMTMLNNDIIHLRPSGNAPELRCYAESNSQANAEKLVNDVLNALRMKL